MDEKELQKIEEKVNSMLKHLSERENYFSYECLELIAEVRRLQEENETYKDLYTTQNTQNMKYKQALDRIVRPLVPLDVDAICFIAEEALKGDDTTE
jgi:acyl-CoA hydrolase